MESPLQFLIKYLNPRLLDKKPLKQKSLKVLPIDSGPLFIYYLLLNERNIKYKYHQMIICNLSN